MHIAILIVICRFFLPSIRSWSRTFQYQNAFFPVVCIMFLACITLDSTFVWSLSWLSLFLLAWLCDVCLAFASFSSFLFLEFFNFVCPCQSFGDISTLVFCCQHHCWVCATTYSQVILLNLLRVVWPGNEPRKGGNYEDDRRWEELTR